MNPQMIKRLQQMQKELTQDQKRLENQEFQGSASGVKVLVLGNKRVVDIKIEKELLEDQETLQDAIIIAINDAITNIDKETEKIMSKYQMPGMPF